MDIRAKWIFSIFMGVLGVVQTYPADSLIDVQADCGKETGTASITVMTETASTVTAECREGNLDVQPTGRDKSIFKLTAALSGTNPNTECAFKEMDTSHVYSLLLRIRANPGLPLLDGGEEREIICNFAQYDESRLMTSDVQIGYRRIEDKVINMNDQSNSTVSVAIVDILGRPVQGTLTLGRRVRLLAESDGVGGEAGIRPIACQALGSADDTETFRTLLSAGCGDGYILNIDSGFTTAGLKALSDPFPVFLYGTSRSLTITCTFAMCSDTCDGQSCESSEGLKRKRRSDSYASGSQAEVVIATSQTVSVDASDPSDWLRFRIHNSVFPTEDLPNPEQDGTGIFNGSDSTLGNSFEIPEDADTETKSTELLEDMPMLDQNSSDISNGSDLTPGYSFETLGRRGTGFGSTEIPEEDTTQESRNLVTDFYSHFADGYFHDLERDNHTQPGDNLVSSEQTRWKLNKSTTPDSPLDQLPWLRQGHVFVVALELGILGTVLFAVMVLWRHHKRKARRAFGQYMSLTHEVSQNDP